MINKFLCIGLLVHASVLYPYREHTPIATHSRYEAYSVKTTITQWDITRVQLTALLLMSGSILTGIAALKTIGAIKKEGPSEDSIGYLIAWSGLTAGLFAASAYHFDKAERMY